jgi:hypothetical protein
MRGIFYHTSQKKIVGLTWIVGTGPLVLIRKENVHTFAYPDFSWLFYS